MSSKKMGMDKRFLSNNPHETGYVCWHTRLDLDGWQKVSATLKIADCNDNAILEFDCEDQKCLEKRIDKITTLIDSLSKFRESLVECNDTLKRTGK